MLTYEVRVQAEPQIAAAFATYMRTSHIPGILATGCFAQIHFEHLAPGVYRTRYLADTQVLLDSYLNDHAAAWRADLQQHFPAGLSVTRDVWHHVQSWTRS
jgi:Domain of unknown function (DUF4286)